MHPHLPKTLLLLVICLLAPVSASAQVNKCISNSGAVSYSDKPCVGGKTKVISATSTCPAYVSPQVHNVARTYILPKERKELNCEIAGVRAKIAQHKARKAQLANPALVTASSGLKHGLSTLEGMYSQERALLSAEEQYLGLLERQKNGVPVGAVPTKAPADKPRVER